MLKIECFVFNPFAVNTYLIINTKNNDAVLIDAACYDKAEEQILSKYIISNNINVKKQINTHCHIDHILGNYFASVIINAPLYIHKAGKVFLDTATNYAAAFGLNINNVCQPFGFIDENSEIEIGEELLNIFYTPGHADGSICLVSHSSKFIITGDVLFNSGIGRTDLPTGNFDLLLKSIKEKIFTLPDDYTVYPGHGSITNIKFEKNHNPFLI
jgi:hydroxyacylglutathione hydrolase